MSPMRSVTWWVLLAACALGPVAACDRSGSGPTGSGAATTGGTGAKHGVHGTQLDYPSGPYVEGVRIVRAGAEPRTALRFAPETGSTQYVTTRNDRRSATSVDGTRVNARELPNTIAITRVDALEAVDESFHMQSVIEGMWVGEEDESGWEDWVSELEVMAGTNMQQLVSPLQMPSSRTLSEPAEGDTPRAVEQAMAHLITLMPVTYPEEPIGVGAVWEVHDYAEISGIGIRMRRHFRLKSIDGRRVVIETAQRHEGTPGPMPIRSESVDYAEQLTRETLVGGSFEMDLALLAPISGWLEGESFARVRVHKGDESHEVATQTTFRHTWEPYEQEEEVEGEGEE